MNHATRQQLTKPNPAVDYFYSAATRRSRGVLWPIFTPARISLKKAIEKAHPTLKELVKVSLSKDKKSIMVLRLAPKDEASEDELENESEDQSKTESEDAN
jgi:hypothetical protein